MHLGEGVRDVRVPVAHADVDGLIPEGLLKEAALLESPLREWRAFGEWGCLKTDLGVAVLELLDDVLREGTAAGDLGEVFGHLGEDVRGAVGEEEDGLGFGHGLSFQLRAKAGRPGSRFTSHSSRWGCDEWGTGAFWVG